MASWREESWRKIKPKCRGCKYQGTDLPCEYILITGKSPQSQGAHINPEGLGGCELYDNGKRKSRIAPLAFMGSKTGFYTVEVKRTAMDKLADPMFLEMHKNGADDAAIAKEAGVSATTVRRWRAEHNLKINDGRRNNKFKRTRSSIDEKLALELYKKGTLDKEIAKKCGVATETIRQWRIRNNLGAVKPRNRVDEKAALILYREGKMDREIAQQLNVQPCSIAAWRHKFGLEANRFKNARKRAIDGENGNS